MRPFRPMALLLLLTASCSDGSSDGGNAGQAVTWHKEIQPLFAERCGGCHTEGGIAPFSLGSYEEASAWKASIREAVESRTMPPWLAGPGCNEYLSDPTLSDEQIALVTGWIDAGAPEGDPADAREGNPPAGGLSRVDRRLEMPTEYTPQIEPDDYRCFLLDWPETETRFVAGFRAIPGNAEVVHHVIAYLITPDLAEAAQQKDDSEEGPGWTCFAGPGVGTGSNGFRWVAAWAPGSAGTEFPDGTGIRIEPGSKIVLQVHYNSHESGPGPDRTAVEVKLEPSVEREALVVPFTNPNWLSGDAMSIPAGDPEVTHAFSMDGSTYAGFLNGPIEAGEPLEIHAAALHMHQLGTRGRIAVKRASGEEACLLDVPHWDFHWQASYSLSTPVRLERGDKFSISCTWDNSAENQTDPGAAPQDVTWGEGSSDEMCLGLLYVTAAAQ